MTWLFLLTVVTWGPLRHTGRGGFPTVLSPCSWFKKVLNPPPLQSRAYHHPLWRPGPLITFKLPLRQENPKHLRSVPVYRQLRP
ncbi:hypothetical protein BJ166DRAFT_365791 [Pestalotiopsis sp. NC0098]|nr:hypothetical protein BJ166DRAFT_365791 [Pestalotiopsis sp. NC0098]